jgi:alpha-beta hydrolase superfamily lysophospholipase
MITEEKTFDTPDGLGLHHYSWKANPTQKAVLVWIHGVSEHAGRYADVAEMLAEKGVTVEALDLRGHGKSPGFRSWVDEFEIYLDDLSAFVDAVREEYPEPPLFVLGHSMGGGILCRWAIERQPEGVRGAIFSAPALHLGRYAFGPLRWAAKWASRFFPKGPGVHLGASGLSRDPVAVKQFREDPLVFHGYLPLRICYLLLENARFCLRHLSEVRLPLLAIHGTGDRATHPAGSEQLVMQAGAADKTLKIYPHLYHDLVHEPERDQVVDDLARWILARSEPDEGK